MKKVKGKKLGRRIVSFVLTVILVVGLMPGNMATVLAEGTDSAVVYADGDCVHNIEGNICSECGFYGYCGAEGSNLTWELALNEDGTTYTLTISGSGAMADYSQGSEVPWHNYAHIITNVVINDGVITIGDRAFINCRNLSTIIIPNGVTTIGDNAFRSCTSLVSVTIPKSVTTVDDYAFSFCTSLTTVTIPKGVTTIGYHAFWGCESLAEVIIPSSVITIEEGAFRSCTSLTTVTISEGVTSIGSSMFNGCTSLTAVTIPSSVITIEGAAFYKCESLTMVTIPEGVTSIGVDVFEECTSLSAVTIPGSVTSIGENAFASCTSLTTVNVPCGWDTENPLYTFDSGVAVNKADHTYPSGECVCGLVCGTCGADGDNLKWTLENGVLTISGTGAMANEQMWEDYINDITSVVMENGVTSIGGNAFRDCTSLNSVTIPESVASIGDYAFENIKVSATINVPCSWNEEPLYTSAYETTVNIAPHQSLTQTASGNVIYEECDVCEHTTGTLTITAENGTYDGASHGATVRCTGTIANAMISIEYFEGNDSLGVYEPANAGTYTAKVTIGEATASVEYTIAGIDSVITAAPTPIADIVYDGTAYYLINEGTATGGTMLYSLEEDGEYSTSIPQGLNAGDYKVWYKVDGDENHNDTTPASIEVTIAPKTLEIGCVTARDRAFDGTNKVEVSEVIISGILNTDNVSVSATATIDSINVGEYSTVDLSGITLTGDAASNYSIVASAEDVDLVPTVTISKAAAPTLSRGSKAYVYNQSYEGEFVSITGVPTDCGEVGYVLLSVSGDMLENISVDRSSGKITYDVKALDSYTEDLQGTIDVNVEMENYETAFYKLTITRRDKYAVTVKDGMSVSLETNELIYGQMLGELAFKWVTFVGEAGEVVTGTLKWEDSNKVPDVATDKASWRFIPDNDVYKEVVGTLDITVKQAPLVVEAVPVVADRTYDPSVTLADVALSGGTVKDEYGDTIEGTWSWVNSDTVPTVVNDGYEAVFTPVDVNYETVTGTITVTVAKATPDIGTVSVLDDELENTTDISTVVLKRTDESMAGTLELTAEALLYGAHGYVWKFTPQDLNNYEVLTGTVAIEVKDTIAPVASYKIGTGDWESFGTSTTYETFSKEELSVEIKAEDSGSGIASVQYYMAFGVIPNVSDIPGWTDYTEAITLDLDRTYVIYVKVTDKGGNEVILNSEGIVVYAESVIAPTSFSCEYGEENSLYVDISTNGNTFANLTDGSGNEIATENYSIDGNELTIKGEYLSDLDVGEYTYKICVNPQGVENTEVTLAYSFVVNVTAKELTVTGATATSRAYIANDKTVNITGITLSGIQGTDDVSVNLTSVKGTLSSDNAGTYTSLTLPALTLTGADKGNYELVQPTGSVTVLVGIEKLNAEIIVEDLFHGKIFGQPPFSLGVSDNNPEAEVTYESDNEDVATVTSEGIVTIHKAGSALITVSLAESTNYISAESKQIIVDVAKKDGYTVDTIQRNYLYSRENADTIDLSAYLPADCGEVTYGTPAVREGQIFSVAPAMNGSVLGYSVAVGEVNDAAQITVTVKSENYADFTITVEPELVDQLPVSPKTEVTLTNDTITYGDALSEMSFEEVVFEDEAGNAVAGTLAWKEATLKPEAGTTSATWVFTPDNEEYAVKEGSVAIVVKKATPVVVAPTVAERVYNPSAVLADSELSGGSATGVDGNDLNGSWSWKVSGTVPVVNNSGYEAVFTPADINNYETVTEPIRVKVNQATPVIAQVNGTTITYGDSLAASTVSGQAKHSDSVDMAVAGSFSWKDTTVKPAVADSDTTAFEVVFTPADSVNYKAVETTAKITVNKAPVAPNKPESSLNVPYTTGTVGETDLPAGWTWQNGETALEVGVVCNAVAVYTGTDAGNYETESVTVAITRAACVHDGETELRDEAEESCTEDGYTGDTYCLICEEKLATGEAIPATGHKDADKNHVCDNGCNVAQGTCEDADKDHACDYGCDKVFGTCGDTDKDHACDYGCDKVYGTCEDVDKDHDCDYGCSKVFGTCEDTDKDHACDYGCSKVFGTCEDTDKDHDCDYGCDKVYGTCEDVDKDHDCDYGCSKVYGTCEDVDKDHDCDYGCDKVFGTCEDTDKDHDCDYGCSKVFGTCEDTDKDHACDYGCSKVFGTCEDTDKDHACDYGCSKVFGTCEDTDKDHDCDYGCDKAFGTCEDTDKDHDCDYGCDKVFGRCEDTDKDHACDYGCDKAFGTCEDTDKDHDCDYGCDKVYGTCEDVDKDHACDYGCDKAFGTCVDTDKDHDCDYGCDKVFGTCEDADKDHDCDYGCDKAFGTHEAASGKHTCEYCGKAVTSCKDENHDHVCDICGEELEHNYSTEWKSDASKHWQECSCGLKKDEATHSGGTATCKDKAVCEVCETVYGELSSTHGENEVRGAVSATCTEDGYTGDTYCKVCDAKLTEGSEIIAEGHSYASKVTKEPTVNEEGERTYTCGACGDSYTEPIAKLEPEPTPAPSATPAPTPTEAPTAVPTEAPTEAPTAVPTEAPTAVPTEAPTVAPTEAPTAVPTEVPTAVPTEAPTAVPTEAPTAAPTQKPAAPVATSAPRDPGKPFLQDDTGKIGWDVIRDETAKAKEGDTIVVDMNGTTEVPGKVFDDIKGKNITITLDMGTGVSWTINGKDITASKVNDINLEVKVGTKGNPINTIPVEVINKVTGERTFVNISLTHDGELGLKAILNINLDKKNSGLYANLFYYNEKYGRMQFIWADDIDEYGTAHLVFTHASEYSIVIDKDIMNKGASYEQAPATGDEGNIWLMILLMSLSFSISFGAIVVRRKSYNSKKLS